jgi:DNA-binding CsgD family transcriptional regulator
MDALDRLPDTYARALRLDGAGALASEIAVEVGVPLEAVPPLLSLGRRKLAAIAGPTADVHRADGRGSSPSWTVAVLGRRSPRLTRDVELIDVFAGVTYRGRAEVERRLELHVDTFEDAERVRGAVIVNDDHAVVEWCVRGRLCDDDAVRIVELSAVAVCDVDGDSLRRIRLYADPDPLTVPRRLSERLTSREREVAALVADGLTNREIALKLVVSVRTVDYHMRRMFGKLGVRTRTALAAAVVDDSGRR